MADNIALTVLLQKADPARTERSFERTVKDLDFEDGAFVALTTSAVPGKLYDVRIRVAGGRSFRCTCLDHHFRAAEVGPCKHVILVVRTVLTSP
jgi:hypothetical protein